MNAVDTNILIYVHDRRNVGKQVIAESLVRTLPRGVLLWQVACEYIAASRKLESFGYSKEKAWQDIHKLRKLWVTHLPTWEMVEQTERFLIYWTSDDYLKELPEYHTTVRLLSECSPIIGQLDTVVGTHRRRTRMLPLARLMKRIVKLGMLGNSLLFDSKHFDRGYLAFEEFFYNVSSVTVEAVAPLHGLEFSENKTLSLSNNVEVSLLTRDEEKKYGYITETERMEYERKERLFYTATYSVCIREDLSIIFMYLI